VRRVLVTRPAGQAADLVGRLSALGIEAISVPTVEIVPDRNGPLATALASLDESAWLVVTSANGAAAVVAALGGRRLSERVRVAAVGPSTASALEGGGVRVDVIPERYLTLAIADALHDVSGRRILLARADAATRELRDALLARGALVNEVVAYRTLEGPATSRDRLRDAVRDGLDGILFTSGSTVRGLITLLPRELRRLAPTIPALCIGPVTARAATAAGFPVAAIAAEHTAAGLAAATAAYFGEEHA
jgi:uroporphyrinogen III methyltransferase / synthase